MTISTESITVTSEISNTIDMIHGIGQSFRNVYLINSTISPGLDAQIGSNYQRILIRERDYTDYLDTTCIKNDCLTYDYTNLTKTMNYTFNLSKLGLNTLPYLTFWHPPDCIGIIRTNSTGHNEHNYKLFANYTSNIVYHFYSLCQNISENGYPDTWQYPCENFNKWKWEIINEPTPEVWNGQDNNYSKLFNQTYYAIKNRVPSAIIGSAGSIHPMIFTELFNNLSPSAYPDFVGHHFYDQFHKAEPLMPSYYTGWTLERAMNNTKAMYYSAPIEFRSQIDAFSTAIPLYNFEYHLSWAAEPNMPHWTETEVSASWLASSLYWQILSPIKAESMLINSEKPQDPFNSGLWTENGTIRPTFYLKKNWIERFRNGSMIYNSISSTTYIESLSNNNYTTINNKRNLTTEYSLKYSNPDVKYIIYDNGTKQSKDSGGFFNNSISAYEVKFIEQGCVYGGTGNFNLDVDGGCTSITKKYNLNGGNVNIIGGKNVQINGSFNGAKRISISGNGTHAIHVTFKGVGI